MQYFHLCGNELQIKFVGPKIKKKKNLFTRLCNCINFQLLGETVGKKRTFGHQTAPLVLLEHDYVILHFLLHPASAHGELRESSLSFQPAVRAANRHISSNVKLFLLSKNKSLQSQGENLFPSFQVVFFSLLLFLKERAQLCFFWNT